MGHATSTTSGLRSPDATPLPTWWGRVATATQVGLALAAVGALVAGIGSTLLISDPRAALDAQDGTGSGGGPGALLGWGSLLQLVATVPTAILFITWLYRALVSERGRRHPRHAAWWAIAGWFVPVMNLFRPYQMVQELYRHTRPTGREGRWPLVLAWWLVWLASFVSSTVAASRWEAVPAVSSDPGWMPGPDDPAAQESAVATALTVDTITFALTAVAAALALVVVRRLTRDVLAVPA